MAQRRKIRRRLGVVVVALGLVLQSIPAEATSSKTAASRKRVREEKTTVKLQESDAVKRSQADNESSPEDSFEGQERVVLRTRPGDTFTQLFTRLKLSQQEKRTWLRSVQKDFPSKKLGGGKAVNFYFQRPRAGAQPSSGKKGLAAIEVGLDEDTVLTWEKGTGEIVFNKRGRSQEVEVKAVRGVIDTSLSEEAQKLGLSSSLLSQMADIFSWDIDFDREIQQGDTFKLVYEVRTQKGKEERRSFRILAAELMNSGKKHFAVYFEKKKGQGNYYDDYGQSLARAFLRFPLEFTRISSPFSQARYHPILKEERPHEGVDFAAARGTPVRAIADGTIQYAGWRRGGYGRTIELLHTSQYGTRYAHLQNVARGIKNGTHVKKGQIIGFVGSSGRTTGPHLHFELYRGGELLDPLKFEFPPEDSIDPALLKVFHDAKEVLIAELAAAQSS